MSNAPLSTLERTEHTAPSVSHGGGNGDHDLYAHYVRKDKHTDAYVFGAPVTALCGKKFVPHRDPKGRTVCPNCKAIFEDLPEFPPTSD